MQETESICQYTISLRMDKMIFSRWKFFFALVLASTLAVVSAEEICTKTVHEGKAKIICGRSIALESSSKDDGVPQEMQKIEQTQPQPQYQPMEPPQQRQILFQPILTVHGKPIMQQSEKFGHPPFMRPIEKFDHHRQLTQPSEKFEQRQSFQPSEKFEHRQLIQPSEKFEHRQLIQPPQKFEHRQLNQPSEKFEHRQLIQPMEKIEHRQLIQPSEKFEHRLLMQPSEKFEHRIQPSDKFEHRKLIKPMEKMDRRKSGYKRPVMQSRQMIYPSEQVQTRQIVLPWQPSQRLPVPPSQQLISSPSNAMNAIEVTASTSPQKSETWDLQPQESKKSKKWSFFKRLNNKWASGFRRKTNAILGAPRYIAHVYHKKVGEFLGVGWGWSKPKKVKVVKHVKHHGWSKGKGPIIWVSGKGHDSHHGWSSHQPQYETTQYEQHEQHDEPQYHDHHDQHYDQHGQNDVQMNQVSGWSAENQYDRKSELYQQANAPQHAEITIPRSKNNSPILALTVKMQLPESADNSLIKKSDREEDEEKRGKKKKPSHMKKLTLAPLEHYRKTVKTSIKPVYV